MKIVNKKPWILPLITLAIPRAKQEQDWLMTWGDTIYNPSGRAIKERELKHERRHSEQQHHSKLIGFFLILRYMLSVGYRNKCEREAHEAETS